MKRIVQFSLFFIVILTLFFFNKLYLSKNNEIIVKSDNLNDQIISKTENNLIKNLKYEVNLDQNKQYIITSDLSELINSNNSEIIKMQKVKALIIDQNRIPLIIKSDNADYNNDNYSTKFRNNVSIEYMNNKIFSDKADLDFENNIAKIFENVRYEGSQGSILSDNIKINLITKKIDIYMNNENDKVQLNKN
ncbi:LPS export ABC transporter periplasmic protein LptC [Candidatus Pelagibacter communis]|uniref:LPS export ABC transporter periplasmic protein LptC n=1 Tax=Pelagibacter ubique TaxID=198252 RepID=UPI00094D990D|nr:LPS export ABC transporter periplasmic protein LptC [Candidatus Pelagibacter ubique]